MKRICIFFAGISLFVLTACDEQTSSTLTGAAIGAGLGMAVSNEDDKEKGALVGAGLGALIANELQKQNRPVTAQSTAQTNTNNQSTNQVVAAHNYAVQQALESGQPERWRYGNSSGTIYPTSSFTEYGLVCRGYDSVWSDGGIRGNRAGRACRQPNGFWKES